MGIPRPFLRLLPPALVLVAAAGMAAVTFRLVRAERALAERTARTTLAGRAAEAAGRIAEAAARLSREAAFGDRAAVLAPDGTFLEPAAPRPLRALPTFPGRDPEGAWKLEMADRAETRDGESRAAEEIYLQATEEGRDPVHRALAWFRLAALRRRLGREEEEAAARRGFLGVLPADRRRSLEGLLARSRASRPDDTLRRDLLEALGSGDDVVVLGLLERADLRDDSSVAARRAELARIDRLRPVIPPAGDPPSGVRLHDGLLVAWERGPDGALRLAEAPPPTIAVDLALRGRGEPDRDEGLIVESVPVGDLLPDVVVTASIDRAVVDADARRRATTLGAVLLVLAVGGAGAVLLALRAARREAELGRMRSDFLARVGHDLRTPLARIRLFAETLASGKVESPDEVREFAGVVEEEAERLSTTVRTVLDLTRLDRGREALRRDRIDLVRLVTEVADAHRPLFTEAGMTLETGTTEARPIVEGDQDALRGAVGNLLENAVRHASPGGHAGIRVETQEGEAVVRVEDRGPGLPEGLGDRIFDRFVRGPTGDGKGAGLGLALVRDVAEAHGGRLDARNGDDGGALFSMTLSLAEEAP